MRTLGFLSPCINMAAAAVSSLAGLSMTFTFASTAGSPPLAAAGGGGAGPDPEEGARPAPPPTSPPLAAAGGGGAGPEREEGSVLVPVAWSVPPLQGLDDEGRDDDASGTMVLDCAREREMRGGRSAAGRKRERGGALSLTSPTV